MLDQPSEPTFSRLHLMTAGLALATGVDAAVRPSAAAPRGTGPVRALARLRWAPLLLAPLAGTAQVLRALRPTPEIRRAARVANAAVVGAALAGVLAGTTELGGRRRGLRSNGGPRPARPAAPLLLAGIVAPLAFGATGLLGLLLERAESGGAGRRLPERDRPRRRRGRIVRIVIRA